MNAKQINEVIHELTDLARLEDMGRVRIVIEPFATAAPKESPDYSMEIYWDTEVVKVNDNPSRYQVVDMQLYSDTTLKA